jgi:hypothetical protein
MRPRRLTLALAAAAVGLCLAAGGVSAQPTGAFGLQFGWGNSYEPRGPRLAICKTDYQIRQAIAARGYANITLNVRGDRRIQVRASLDGATYLLDYDFCTDTIVSRRVLR